MKSQAQNYSTATPIGFSKKKKQEKTLASFLSCPHERGLEPQEEKEYYRKVIIIFFTTLSFGVLRLNFMNKVKISRKKLTPKRRIFVNKVDARQHGQLGRTGFGSQLLVEIKRPFSAAGAMSRALRL